jgi:uncharacterized protein YjbI with pentapeptide repeats
MTEVSVSQQFQIKHWSGRVLYEFDVPGGIESGMVLRHALERATSEGKSLSGADLRDAVLRDAVLRDADLSGAVLRGAVLRGADLSGADLSGADLRDADLRGADLRGADLRDADLRGAVLRDAVLREQKTDFWEILLRAPREIAGLRSALVEGRVDGSTYEGVCACLVGTIANVRGINYDDLGNGIKPDSDRPAERWFMNIRKGDTPETNQVSALTVQWLDEFVGLLEAARATGA